jgi:hypothetical protein
MRLSEEHYGTARTVLIAFPFDSMLTIGSFAIAFLAVLGSVWWACLDDKD